MDVPRFKSRPVIRFGKDTKKIDDHIAIEEPLELRLAGETIATTMRTPGHDHLLAKGFFFNEGFIKHHGQIGQVIHCGRVGTPEFGNVVDVLPAPGVLFNFEGAAWVRRGSLTTSSCGVCGRSQIDDLVSRCEAHEAYVEVDDHFVAQATQMLAAHQDLFDTTGAVHAAAAVDNAGELIACFEDVGRHNATDKVFGRVLEMGAAGTVKALVVSGRISFEIVQKAAMGGSRMIIGISAPTSLAVELAESLKIALVGFARGDRWTLYTH